MPIARFGQGGIEPGRGRERARRAWDVIEGLLGVPEHPQRDRVRPLRHRCVGAGIEKPAGPAGPVGLGRLGVVSAHDRLVQSDTVDVGVGGLVDHVTRGRVHLNRRVVRQLVAGHIGVRRGGAGWEGVDDDQDRPVVRVGVLPGVERQRVGLVLGGLLEDETVVRGCARHDLGDRRGVVVIVETGPRHRLGRVVRRVVEIAARRRPRRRPVRRRPRRPGRPRRRHREHRRVHRRRVRLPGHQSPHIPLRDLGVPRDRVMDVGEAEKHAGRVGPVVADMERFAAAIRVRPCRADLTVRVRRIMDIHRRVDRDRPCPLGRTKPRPDRPEPTPPNPARIAQPSSTGPAPQHPWRRSPSAQRARGRSPRGRR